jgi:hypothetical protein
VRILLPHTVYIYPKKPLQESEVHVSQATYLVKSNKIVCYLQNNGDDLGRVQEVRVTAGHESATAAGFPLLPGGKRHVEVSWNGKEPPQVLLLRFEHFTIKQPLSTSNE